MAEVIDTSHSQHGTEQAKSGPNGQDSTRGPPRHEIYCRPAPIRTFPLPNFYPNNPLSFLHLAYVWISQTIRPPALEPSIIHHGVWSPATHSVHILDEKSMRLLWEQGFYGKGNLSRSEPNWLRREQVRQGQKDGHVSELFTQQRREERQRAKWERARLEQEAIQQTRLEEARQAEELSNAKVVPEPMLSRDIHAPVGPLQLLALPNSTRDAQAQTSIVVDKVQKPANGNVSFKHQDVGLEITEPPSPPTSSSDILEAKLKSQKSVRFSPTVESTTFLKTDPPSPCPSPPEKQTSQPSSGVDVANANGSPDTSAEPLPEIQNREHLQLTPEEAFWLTFGLGALHVTDPDTGLVLPNSQLLTLLRQSSYFPPKDAISDKLYPDDNFLVNYALYHHFRSLGWVPRPGVKFGVDWLLYAKGPVFDHAQFGLIIVPSYCDPLWKEAGKQSPVITWRLLHSVVRVLSHAIKSLVLVYVDVPPPAKFEEKLKVGFTEALKLYKIREVPVKRWSPNRNK